MNKEFHIPFLHSLVIIGVVTLVTLFSSKYFIEKTMLVDSYPPDYSHLPSVLVQENTQNKPGKISFEGY
jgi:hypothetical protein